MHEQNEQEAQQCCHKNITCKSHSDYEISGQKESIGRLGFAHTVFANALNKANAFMGLHPSWCPTLPCPVLSLWVPQFNAVQRYNLQETQTFELDTYMIFK